MTAYHVCELGLESRVQSGKVKEKRSVADSPSRPNQEQMKKPEA